MFIVLMHDSVRERAFFLFYSFDKNKKKQNVGLLIKEKTKSKYVQYFYGYFFLFNHLVCDPIRKQNKQIDAIIFFCSLSFTI